MTTTIGTTPDLLVGPGVRLDSGVVAGSVVPGSFDSLMAKLVVTGATTAKVESANTGIKNIKRAGRGFTNSANYRVRILLASAARAVA